MQTRDETVRHKLMALAVVAAGWLSAADYAGAAIVNGGFESGNLTGWTAVGAASIVDASFGSGPTEGSFQALLSTGTGAVSDSVLEATAGLSPGHLDGYVGLLTNFNSTDATEGSLLRLDFTAPANSILSFDFNFLTTEETPDTDFDDYAFVVVNGSLFADLADTQRFIVDVDPSTTRSDQFLASSTIFSEETGFHTFLSWLPPAGGSFSLSLGVVDAEDINFNSALLIDNVRLIPRAVPEPIGFALLGTGLTAFGLLARRRRGG